MTLFRAFNTPETRRWLIVVGAVCLLAVLLRWPSIDVPIDNDGGARAYHARLILAGEPLYSTHHTGHHLPGIYYTNALAFWLFGDSDWSVKFLLILWTIPTIYMLYRLGTLALSRRAGLLGAVFYAFFSAQLQMWGLTAETELFANLPRITAVFLLLTFWQKRAPAWKFLFVGLFGAWASLYKAVYITPFLMAGLLLALHLWQNRQEPGQWQETIKQGVWITIGVALVLLPVIAYFAATGLFARFFSVFTIGQSYVSGSDFIDDARGQLGDAYRILYLLFPMLGLTFNNIFLFGYSIVSCWFILRIKKLRHSMAIFIVVWYIASFIPASINFQLFTHYYLLVAPAMSLLAAWFIFKVADDLSQNQSLRKIAPLVLVLLLAFPLIYSVSRNANFYANYLQFKVGQAGHNEYISQGWPDFGERLVRVAQLADYVRANTLPADKVYYWSEDVQLYYLAGRRSASDTIWPIDIGATGPPDRIFSPETSLIIVDLRREPAAPPWFFEALDSSYKLEAVIDEQAIYRHVDETG